MKWGYLFVITLILGASIFLGGCTNTGDGMIRVEDINCREMGYITVSEANELISINNRLTTLVNACYEDTGLEPLPYIKPYE